METKQLLHYNDLANNNGDETKRNKNKVMYVITCMPLNESHVTDM